MLIKQIDDKKKRVEKNKKEASICFISIQDKVLNTYFFILYFAEWINCTVFALSIRQYFAALQYQKFML